MPLWVQFAVLQVQRFQSSLPNTLQQSIVEIGLGSLGQEQQSLWMVQVTLSHVALVTGQNLHQHFAHRNITMLTIFGSWPTTNCCYSVNAFQGLGDLDSCLVKLNAIPCQTDQFWVAETSAQPGGKNWKVPVVMVKMWFRIVLTSVLLKMSVAMGLGGTLILWPRRPMFWGWTLRIVLNTPARVDRLNSSGIHPRQEPRNLIMSSAVVSRTAAPISRYDEPDHDQCSAAVAPAVPLATGQHNLDPMDDTNPVMYPDFQSDNPTIFSGIIAALAKQLGRYNDPDDLWSNQHHWFSPWVGWHHHYSWLWVVSSSNLRLLLVNFTAAEPRQEVSLVILMTRPEHLKSVNWVVFWVTPKPYDSDPKCWNRSEHHVWKERFHILGAATTRIQFWSGFLRFNNIKVRLSNWPQQSEPKSHGEVLTPVGSDWSWHFGRWGKFRCFLWRRFGDGLGQLNPAPAVPASNRSCW